MPEFRYPVPTASPYDDFGQYIPYLITAVEMYLLNPHIWEDSEQVTALGYMQELLAFLIELEALMQKSITPTEIIITYGMTEPVLLKSVQPNEIVDELLVTVDSAFDTGVLSIGDDLQHDRLMKTDENLLMDENGQFQVTPQIKFSETTDIFVYLTGTPTTGVARVTLYSYRT